MNGQLLCGLVLAAAALAAGVAGAPWLAVATALAAMPFLAVGILFAISAWTSRGPVAG